MILSQQVMTQIERFLTMQPLSCSHLHSWIRLCHACYIIPLSRTWNISAWLVINSIKSSKPSIESTIPSSGCMWKCDMVVRLLCWIWILSENFHQSLDLCNGTLALFELGSMFLLIMSIHITAFYLLSCSFCKGMGKVYYQVDVPVSMVLVNFIVAVILPYLELYLSGHIQSNQLHYIVMPWFGH